MVYVNSLEDLQKKPLNLHDPGLGQSKFTREKHVNCQKYCQKVSQLIEK